MQTLNAAVPALSFGECLWNTLHRDGWNLSHYTFNEQDGSLRHMVRARLDGDEMLCSAPTLALAVQVIYNHYMQME